MSHTVRTRSVGVNKRRACVSEEKKKNRIHAGLDIPACSRRAREEKTKSVFFVFSVSRVCFFYYFFSIHGPITPGLRSLIFVVSTRTGTPDRYYCRIRYAWDFRRVRVGNIINRTRATPNNNNTLNTTYTRSPIRNNIGIFFFFYAFRPRKRPVRPARFRPNCDDSRSAGKTRVSRLFFNRSYG